MLNESGSTTMKNELSIFARFMLVVLLLTAMPVITSPAPADSNDGNDEDRLSLRLGKKGNIEDTKYWKYGGGVNVNARDDEGRTPLSLAASFNSDPEIITALVKAGADINSRSNIKWTPIYWAAWNSGNPDVITALLAVGANVNERDARGMTPMMVAAALNGDPAIIAALARAGANVNEQDMDGRTPLMWALRVSFWLDDLPKPETITALLNAGADPKIKDIYGMRAADYAKDNENLAGTEAYQNLLVQGDSPEAGDKDGAANYKTPAPEEEFSSFLRKFLEDEEYQRKSTMYPLTLLELDYDHPDLKAMIWHQELHEVSFPIIPLERDQKEQPLEIEIDRLTENEAEVRMHKPDTSYTIYYHFRKKNGWMLEQKTDTRVC
jgi:ankyrin repeat protein